MNDSLRTEAKTRLADMGARLTEIQSQLEAARGEEALEVLCEVREQLSALFALLLVGHLSEHLPGSEQPFDPAQLSLEARALLSRFFKTL